MNIDGYLVDIYASDVHFERSNCGLKIDRGIPNAR